MIDAIPLLHWLLDVASRTTLVVVVVVALLLFRQASALTRCTLWRVAFVALLVLPVVRFGDPLFRLEIEVPGSASTTGVGEGISGGPKTVPTTLPEGALGPNLPIPAMATAEGATAERATIAKPTQDGSFAMTTAANTRIGQSRIDGAVAPNRGLDRAGADFVEDGWAWAHAFGVALWAAGALLLLLRLCAAHMRAFAILRRATPLPFPSAFQIRVSAATRTPMVIGIVRPIVVLTNEAANTLGPTEIDHIVAHESAHIVRNDNLWLLIASLVRVIYWPLPWVWWATAQHRDTVEFAADDATLCSGVDSVAYARTLLKLARWRTRPAISGPFATMNGGLSVRIERLFCERQSRTSGGRWHGRLSLAAVGLAITGLSTIELACAVPIDEVVVQRHAAADDTENPPVSSPSRTLIPADVGPPPKRVSGEYTASTEAFRACRPPPLEMLVPPTRVPSARREHDGPYSLFYSEPAWADTNDEQKIWYWRQPDGNMVARWLNGSVQAWELLLGGNVFVYSPTGELLACAPERALKRPRGRAFDREEYAQYQHGVLLVDADDVLVAFGTGSNPLWQRKYRGRSYQNQSEVYAVLGSHVVFAPRTTRGFAVEFLDIATGSVVAKTKVSARRDVRITSLEGTGDAHVRLVTEGSLRSDDLEISIRLTADGILETEALGLALCAPGAEQWCEPRPSAPPAVDTSSIPAIFEARRHEVTQCLQEIPRGRLRPFVKIVLGREGKLVDEFPVAGGLRTAVSLEEALVWPALKVVTRNDQRLNRPWVKKKHAAEICLVELLEQVSFPPASSQQDVSVYVPFAR